MPYDSALGATILLHLLFKNPMISIFGSTILFMVLSRLM
jgi:branched-subunit amino acid transport protein AzlD